MTFIVTKEGFHDEMPALSLRQRYKSIRKGITSGGHEPDSVCVCVCVCVGGGDIAAVGGIGDHEQFSVARA